MSSVLEKAISHWDGIKNGTVEVPEWGITVHFTRPTLAEHAAIQKRINEDPALASATLVQERALDAKGNRLFDDELETTNKLRRGVDPNVVSRIAQAVLKSPSQAEAGKN